LVAVRANFRKEFHRESCTDDKDPVVHDRHSKDSDLWVTSAHGSNQGSFLVETEIKRGACDEYIDDRDDPFADQWFFVSKDLTFRRLGGLLELLDARDYDGDRKSEVIFPSNATGGYGRLRFVLRRLQKQVENTWTYH
jgi:hypothetical protein